MRYLESESHGLKRMSKALYKLQDRVWANVITSSSVICQLDRTSSAPLQLWTSMLGWLVSI